MKLTNDQIESIRAVSPELAEKLEAGEKVTVERSVEKWEPEVANWYVATDGQIVHHACNPSSMMNYTRNGVQRKTREAAERLAQDQRIFNRLHAYRDEFAPGYVVPPLGKMAWCPIICDDGQYRTASHTGRNLTAIYMPPEICEDLCRKLNSGEVVL